MFNNKKELGIHFYILGGDGSDNLDDYEQMKELLEKHGIYINIADESDKYGRLFCSIDVFPKKLSREAGSRTKIVELKNKRVMLKLSDIEKMRENMSDEEIVSKLNIGRATYYRHLKKAKEKAKNGFDPYF